MFVFSLLSTTGARKCPEDHKDGFTFGFSLESYDKWNKNEKEDFIEPYLQKSHGGIAVTICDYDQNDIYYYYDLP